MLVRPPPRIHQHHRLRNLPLGHGPIAGQQLPGFLLRNAAKPVALVEGDGPRRRLPRADQDRPIGEAREMRQQLAAKSSVLVGRARVGMADERHVAHVLQPHHGRHHTLLLTAPEHHTRREFVFQLAGGHVRLSPAVGRNLASVGAGTVVDDGEDLLHVVWATATDHGTLVSHCTVHDERCSSTSPTPS